MAGLGAKLFSSFSKLTAAQVNGYLMDQSIMRFANAAARDAAFGGAGEPTLAEGMTCYLDDTNVVQSYTGSAWVEIASSDGKAPRGIMTSVTSASVQSIAGGSFQDITSLTSSVTLVNNRIYMVLTTIGVANPAAATAGLNFKCLFGATDVGTQGFNQRVDAAQHASFQGIYYFQATSSGAVTVKMQAQAYAQATLLSVSFSNHRMTVIDIGSA
jgi:hypothetical protein